MNSLATRRVIKLHKNILFWAVQVTVEAPTESAYGGFQYAFGSGKHPEWRLSWWRRK